MDLSRAVNFVPDYEYKGTNVEVSAWSAELVGSNQSPSYLVDNFELNKTIKLSGSPAEPRHDYVNITLNISDMFQISRVIEIVFYKFDSAMGQDSCYYVI